MQFCVLTLFPDYFDSALQSSILKRAIERSAIAFEALDIRDYTLDKHRRVDDAPYGGGAGLVMQAQPVVAAIEDAKAKYPRARTVLLGPSGQPFCQDHARRWSEQDLILVCGHYEGVDHRVRSVIDEEISLGDFVLTGGEPAALCIVDAVARLCEDVLGNAESSRDESFCGNRLLEYPQYSRPRVWRGAAVPEILLSGNHAAIAQWRLAQSLSLTLAQRPDHLAHVWYQLSEEIRDQLMAMAPQKCERIAHIAALLAEIADMDS